MTPPWADIIPEADLAVFAAAGYGGEVPLGERPALLIVDVTYAFTGSRPMPIMEAVRECRTSCGEAAWTAVRHIQRLSAAARHAEVPVFYTRARPVAQVGALGRWAAKNSRATEDLGSSRASDIVAELEPRSGDFIIDKSKPSAFFGTDLLALLVLRKIDTLIVTGGAASGCVRSTAVDAFSYNFAVAVVAEATFDRSELVRAVSLFDLNQKYANVISTPEALAYLTDVGATADTPIRPTSA
jgi:maleamate amidohydrolase